MSILTVVLGLALAGRAAATETTHELRITSLTILSVAQQNLNAAVCSSPSRCLQNEVRLPVFIDFDAGTIRIDARNPVDENGDPVPPGGPGGILFQTQSGAVEMRFAPPCENPDGCVGGEAVYFGTIDQGGHIAFPSVGIDFELFGISPISKFRGPMGTGATTDPADPTVVAQGTLLDFATGAVQLAGIDFIPAPIIGTSLQLERITGTISPVPIPPVDLKDVLRCQTAIEKQGATYGKKVQAALERCTDALVGCEVNAEAGSGGGPACIAAAKTLCDAAVATIDSTGLNLTRAIRNACRSLGAPNMLATTGGLGFSLDTPLCSALGQTTSTRDGIASCMERRMLCSVEELFARSEPRAAEVLAANGYSTFVAPLGCMPAFAPADATGLDGGALMRCQTAITRQETKYAAVKQKKLSDCFDQMLNCHLTAESIQGPEPGGGHTHVHDPVCIAKSQKSCDAAVRSIAAAAQKRLIGMQAGCTALDAAGIPAIAAGLGISNLTELCASLPTPITLNSVDDLISCLNASIDCSLEATVGALKPRAHEAGHSVGIAVGGVLVTARFECIHPRCGDGIVNSTEQCDPLFDPDQRCNADCTAVACGNGRTEPGEQCDDGNTTSGDGCSATCVIEPSSCANGVVEPFGGEVCDDGDTAAGDGCNANCTSKEVCGNGVVDTIMGEVCDDGGTGYVATLDGTHVAPAVVTAATGSATLTLNGDDTLTYDVQSSGLSATGAHIHLGAPGVSGPVVFTLAGGPTTWSGTTAALTIDQLAELKAGSLYVDVHTTANPGGEIRGQLGFAPPVGGDGCSADCRSDETCGNGVLDAGEACDDGNALAGDGCDTACQIEACSFISGPALGTRTFSIDTTTSGLFNSIVGLGTRVGTIDPTSQIPTLSASATDASGTATVTLDVDTIVQLNIPLGGQVQCFKFEAAGSVGSLHCCGGAAVGMSSTRDSNTGGLPATGGQSNGPAVTLAGIGTGGIGDLLMAFRVRQFAGPTGTNCLTATYGAPSTQYWTTGRAAGRVVRPAQGGALFEFATTGEPFDCANWTNENGPGVLISADTALNAVPGVDGGNIRKLDD
jgi:cysteine-rich repeat protein